MTELGQVGRTERAMLRAIVEQPGRTWTIIDLASMGDWRCEKAQNLMDWLTSNGLAEAFWDRPSQRLEQASGVAPSSRCYRATSAGLMFMSDLIQPLPPKRGIVGAFVFDGWRSGWTHARCKLRRLGRRNQADWQ